MTCSGTSRAAARLTVDGRASLAPASRLAARLFAATNTEGSSRLGEESKAAGERAPARRASGGEQDRRPAPKRISSGALTIIGLTGTTAMLWHTIASPAIKVSKALAKKLAHEHRP
jgi:hypothetical protein